MRGYAKAVLAVLAMVAPSAASRAQPGDYELRLVTPFVVMPVPSKWPPKAEPKNAILQDLLRSSREPTILLASDDGRASLLVGANRSGFGAVLPLPVEAFDLHLTEGSGDTLWIGGYRKPTMSMFSMPLSFAYLAKVDRLGHFSWEREFGGESRRTIESMVSLPSGDIVVSGQDSRRTWLARISDDGKIVWERFVGLGKGSAITTIDGTIMLAAVESGPLGSSYREDVGIWTFDEAGELRDHRVIRQGINGKDSDSSGRIRIERSGDALYVFSAWDGYGLAKPLEVVKFDPRDGVVWRTELAATVIKGVSGRSHYCSAVITILSNGDPLIACRSGDRKIELWRLNARSGAIAQSVVQLAVPLPHCSKSWEFWSQERFLKQSSETAVWIFGSPYGSAGSPCGWIAEAPVPEAE